MRLQLALLAILMLLPAATAPLKSTGAQAPLLWTYDVGEEVYVVDISNNGSIVAYASQSKVGLLSSLGTQTWYTPANPTIARKGLDLSPDGTYLIFADGEKVALYTTTAVKMWEKSYAPYAAAEVSTSAEGLVSAVVESTRLHIYNRAGAEIGSASSVRGDFQAVDVSANGVAVAAGGDILDTHIYMYSPDGSSKWPPYDAGWEVYDVELDPGGRFLAAAADKMFFFDSSGLVWSTWLIGASSVSVSAQALFIAVGAPSGVYLYTKTGSQLAAWSTSGDVLSVSISGDGAWIAAGSEDGFVYMFSRDSGLVWSYNTGSRVNCVAISADGSCVAAASGTRVYYFSQAAPGGDLSGYPEPFVSAGVLNVTFIIGDSAPHGFYGLGAWTMDVGGAIAIASRLGVEASSGAASWGLDTWYAEWTGSDVAIDWSSVPVANVIYAGGPGVNMFAWKFEKFGGCPFYAILIDGVPCLHSDLTGEDYSYGSGYDYALIALHYHQGRWHLLAWGLTANGTAAASQVLQHYDMYPGVLDGRAVIIRWEDTNGNGVVDLGDSIEGVEHWSG